MASARLVNPSGSKKPVPKAKEANKAPTANISRKRKGNEDDKHQTSPPAKKARAAKKTLPPSAPVRKARATTKTASPPAPVKKAQAAKKTPPPKTEKTTPKPKVIKPKVVKPKVVINKAPTERLNVYVFGEGSSSELGLGTAKTAIDVKRPRLNPLLPSGDVGIVHIACGGMHVAALTHDNKILTWGVNDQGALGRDTTWGGGLKDIDDNESDDSDQSDSGLNPLESIPTAVPASNFPEGTTFVQLSAGDSHTLALTDEGLVYGWGCFRKTDGVLGFRPNSDIEIERTPILVPELKNITHITSGANHAMAMDDKGAVFIWGSGEQNQLGYHIIQRTGAEHNKTTLKPQPLRTKTKFYKAVYTGSDHSFAIDRKDRLWAWGVNSFGGCGIREGAGEDNAVVYTPSLVQNINLKDDSITHIDGGQHHTIVVTQNGKALVWGRVDGYQVGLDMSTLPEENTIRDTAGKVRIVIVPTPIPDLGKAAWASAGTDHTIVINDKGIAYAWGLSATYQTGLATTDDVKMPTHIDNTAVRGKHLNWSGCGGQYSVMTAPAEALTNGI
ncbi:hypothetical protein ACLMJK_004432 [Lecanora helva]